MLEDILARLPELSNRATLSPEAQASFDAIAGTRGSVHGPFAMLLHSPELAERAAHLGAYIRFGSQLPDAERELAIITTARSFDCDYEWAAHARIASDVGVSKEAIDIVANREPVSGLFPRRFRTLSGPGSPGRLPSDWQLFAMAWCC